MFENPRLGSLWESETSKYLKRGLSQKGLQMILGIFFIFWPNYTNFFEIVTQMGAFIDILEFKDLSAIVLAKNSHFWAKNGPNTKNLPFLTQKWPFLAQKNIRHDF